VREAERCDARRHSLRTQSGVVLVPGGTPPRQAARIAASGCKLQRPAAPCSTHDELLPRLPGRRWRRASGPPSCRPRARALPSCRRPRPWPRAARCPSRRQGPCEPHREGAGPGVGWAYFFRRHTSVAGLAAAVHSKIGPQIRGARTHSARAGGAPVARPTAHLAGV
jgi:hypothetical protein